MKTINNLISSSKSILPIFPIVLISLTMLFSQDSSDDKNIEQLIKKNELVLVKQIIEINPEVAKISNKDGVSPLHMACVFGMKDIAILLLNAGADINHDAVSKKRGFTIIWTALLRGHKNMVELLVQNGADLSSKFEGKSILSAVAKNDWQDVYKLMISKGAKPDLESLSAMKQNQFGKALTDGDVEEVIKLLQESPSMVKVDLGQGYTPLHVAADKNHYKILNFLIERGADINATVNYGSEFGNTPLHYAAARGHLESVKILLKAGAKANVKSSGGKYTPLHDAVFPSFLPYSEKMPNNPKIVKMLLEYGADVNIKNEYGDTPLHIAAEHGRVEMMRILLKNGADIGILNNENNDVLIDAVRSRNLKAVRLLLEYKANPNLGEREKWTALHYAANDLHYNSKMSGGFFNEKINYYDQIQMIELLLKYGGKINVSDKKGTTPLHYAVEACNKTLVKYLIQNGAEVDVIGEPRFVGIKETPAMTAANVDCIEIVEILKQYGAKIDKTTEATILASRFRQAINRDDLETVQELATENPFLLITEHTADHYSPLQLAIKQKNIEMVKLLLSKGADVNYIANGPSVLHIAIEAGNDEISKLLIDSGAKLNVKNSIGCTPLYYAVKSNAVEIAEYLLKSGADPNDARVFDLSYLEYAQKLGFEAMIKILEKYGAKKLIK